VVSSGPSTPGGHIMFATVKSWFTRSSVSARDSLAWERDYLRTIKARYDSAQTTVENERYWALADGKSARAALDPTVRARIRSRARYEAQESGSYARGMVMAKVNDVVGRGPSLQVTTTSKEFNRAVERAWRAWSAEINLGAKLRTMAMAYYIDGEAFAERIQNPRLRNQVKLDLSLSEADLWTDPNGLAAEANRVDGIRYDDAGNPVEYTRLKAHPGDDFFDPDASALDSETVDADNVIHWFHCSRPGQRRGVSHLATALPLFAELRRYRLATIAAAETAAYYSAVMYSDAKRFDEAPDEVDEFLPIDIERRSMLTLPAGWKIAQLKSEQPTTQFGPFSESILTEIGRCTQTPLNIILGSSREYNFASGRLDYLLYWGQNDVDRADCEAAVVERVFAWWLDEALLVPGLLPPLGDIREVEHRFVFPPRRPIDELKSAQTDQIQMAMGHLTDEMWATREATDLEQHYDQLRRMKEARDQIGIGMASEMPAPPINDPAGNPDETQTSKGNQARGRRQAA
jgi:capsid protein